MASLSNIAQVSIVIGTNAIQSTSFSTMMVMRTAAPANTPLVLIVVSTADLITQTGVATTDPLYLAVSDVFGQSPGIQQVMIGAALATDASIATSLNNINTAAQNLGGFYGFVVADRTIATIKACADWAQANTKLFGFATAEADAINAVTVDDTLSYIKTNNYARSYGFYHAAAATDYPDAGVMSRCFTVAPGGENWSNIQLLGVSTDALAAGARAAVIGKNGNTYEAYGNITMTFNGMVGSGERIDVVRFVDWLTNQIQVCVGNVLVGTNKVPYTDQGISAIKSGVAQALDQGISSGGISPPAVNTAGTVIPSYIITTPQRASIPASAVASRVLSGVSFIAQLAGAINTAVITGTVTYGNLS